MVHLSNPGDIYGIFGSCILNVVPSDAQFWPLSKQDYECEFFNCESVHSSKSSQGKLKNIIRFLYQETMIFELFCGVVIRIKLYISITWNSGIKIEKHVILYTVVNILLQ